MTVQEQKLIIGGSGKPLSDADLQALFDFNDPSIGGFNSTLGQE